MQRESNGTAAELTRVATCRVGVYDWDVVKIVFAKLYMQNYNKLLVIKI